jgi:hypothetical protein
MRPVIKVPSRAVLLSETNDSLRHLLIESLGSYCMFCESPLTIDIPVSQRVSTSPKAASFSFDGRSFSYTVGVGSYRSVPGRAALARRG